MMISRLAPTPSGYLHWGNFLNFALTSSAVRAVSGTLWLRIDDVDSTRMRPEYVQEVFDTLHWLGLEWDRGPRSAEEFFKEYSQHLRKEEYWAKAETLRTYACDCSRQQIQARRPDGRYDGHCRKRAVKFEAGVTALRVMMPEFDDPVVWTKDDRPAYHLVSVLDDLRMGVTHIVRGEDLRESSHLQNALARQLGEPAYAKILHGFHPLLLGADGKKLSKSADSESLHSLRAAGAKAKEAWSELARRADLQLPMVWSTLNEEGDLK